MESSKFNWNLTKFELQIEISKSICKLWDFQIEPSNFNWNLTKYNWMFKNMKWKVFEYQIFEI